MAKFMNPDSTALHWATSSETEEWVIGYGRTNSGHVRDGHRGCGWRSAGQRLPSTVGYERPGPLGIDSPVPLAVTRIIADVSKDWEPPNPRITPAIVVRGQTLADVATELNRLAEWGEGGGMLRAGRILPGTSTNLTVRLHANLVMRLPTWTAYSEASDAAKREWDRMLERLRVHEQRHVEIAIEEANRLASMLVGREITEIADLVTAANRAVNQRQIQLDTDTGNGSRPGVATGTCRLIPRFSDCQHPGELPRWSVRMIPSILLVVSRCSWEADRSVFEATVSKMLLIQASWNAY